ncbi:MULTISPECIES: hypothetical protein [Desulfofundulus]|uniref:Uncharacterized protein n=1 Tax=Desulfofundulus thermosubterraneus DSM 16057 TaxID=1121432 RepID=A0A1M6JSX1_9FIRM|nr:MULTISPECIES: hypothetical protein [Desulfofundulus]MDK2888951.1 hypothetical protein [Thermoanaerobacter sp.]SHJ49722.1 hypothetical protein SAMN02745219_02693 [Desulfofundulus thermosubterraneus DSM 16057]
MKKARVPHNPGRVVVKSLRKGPWLINYRLQGGKIVYLLWATKGLGFLKNWGQE